MSDQDQQQQQMEELPHKVPDSIEGPLDDIMRRMYVMFIDTRVIYYLFCPIPTILLFSFFFSHFSINEDDVVGVIVADKGGSCVGCQGSLIPLTAARITNIFDCALKMAPDIEIQNEEGIFLVPECPTIVIETTKGNLIINNIDDFSTTIAVRAR